jgi:stage II sporulation protein AA (anti-sigma F factor antagonist)
MLHECFYLAPRRFSATNRRVSSTHRARIDSQRSLAIVSSSFSGIVFMNLATEKTGEVLVVSPEGRINSTNASALEADLLAQVEKGERKVVLDLSRLDYISSAGLRVILLLAKRLKQQSGGLVLCGLLPHVREVFEISGFLGILTAVDSRSDALAKLA